MTKNPAIPVKDQRIWRHGHSTQFHRYSTQRSTDWRCVIISWVLSAMSRVLGGEVEKWIWTFCKFFNGCGALERCGHILTVEPRLWLWNAKIQIVGSPQMNQRYIYTSPVVDMNLSSLWVGPRKPDFAQVSSARVQTSRKSVDFLVFGLCQYLDTWRSKFRSACKASAWTLRSTQRYHKTLKNKLFFQLSTFSHSWHCKMLRWPLKSCWSVELKSQLTNGLAHTLTLVWHRLKRFPTWAADWVRHGDRLVTGNPSATLWRTARDGIVLMHHSKLSNRQQFRWLSIQFASLKLSQVCVTWAGQFTRCCLLRHKFCQQMNLLKGLACPLWTQVRFLTARRNRNLRPVIQINRWTECVVLDKKPKIQDEVWLYEFASAHLYSFSLHTRMLIWNLIQSPLISLMTNSLHWIGQLSFDTSSSVLRKESLFWDRQCHFDGKS